ALPVVGCTAVTTTLISGKRSASKKSADRRCSSRLPIPVRNDAAWMSRRPKMAPLPVTWPSALKSVNRPLTLIRPHMFLILKLIVDLSGTRVHTPAVSGSFSSVSTVVICAAPPHRFALHRHRRGSYAPLLLIASLCIVTGAGHVRRSSSSLRSASSPARVMCAPPPHRFALHRRRRGSSAPPLPASSSAVQARLGRSTHRYV